MKEDIDQFIKTAPDGKELQSLIYDGNVFYQKSLKFGDSEYLNKHNFRYSLNDLVNEIKTIKSEKSSFDYDFQSFVKFHEPQFEKTGTVFIGAVLVNNSYSLISARDGELLLNLH